MNFDFGNVLTRAWQIIWKHKILWLFGILASCTRGGGGRGSGGTGYQFSSGEQPPPITQEFTRLLEQLSQWLTDNWWIVVAAGLTVIFLSVIFALIGFIGKIGLIIGTYKAETGAATLNWSELFPESMLYFWRVFGLNFLIGLAFFIIFVPLILMGILTAGIGFICILPLICILVPLAWIIMVILEQANAAIVIEDLRMFDGFKRGWEIVKANAGPVIIMALILIFGGGIVTLLLSIPIFFTVLPLIPSLIAGEFQRSGLLIAGLCFVAYLPILIVLNGILSAYIQSAWTLTYMRLTAPKENAPVSVEANA